MKVAVVLLVFASVAALAAPTPDLPGFRTTISQAGINHVKDQIVPYLVSLIGDIDVPDTSGSESGIHYSVTNTKMTGFSLDAQGSSVAFNENDNTIAVHIANGAAKSSCDWKWSTYLSIHGSGSATVEMSRATVNVVFTLGTTSDGHPQISVTTCNVSFGQFDVHISSGTIGKFYNLLVGLLKDQIKSKVESEVGSQLKDVIQGTGNQELAKLPLVQPIDDTSEIDMSLMSSAKVTGSMVNTGHKGEFYRKNARQEFDGTPSKMPDSVTDQMLQVFVDQYVFNSAAKVYFDAGVNSVEVHDSDIPSESPFRLKTTSFEAIWPELYEAYPDNLMECVLTATAAPVLDIDAAAKVAVPGTVQLNVVDSDGNSVKVLTLEGAGDGSAAPALNDRTISVQIESLVVESLKVDYAKFSGVQEDKIADGINNIVKFVLIPILQKKNPLNVDIPVVEGVVVSNGKATIQPKFILASVDVDYKPNFELAWASEQDVDKNTSEETSFMDFIRKNSII